MSPADLLAALEAACEASARHAARWRQSEAEKDRLRKAILAHLAANPPSEASVDVNETVLREIEQELSGERRG